MKRKLKQLFRWLTTTLDSITMLDAFEKVLISLATAAFWGIIVGVFLIINSPAPWRECLLIICSVGMIAIYIGYHRQKEQEKIEQCGMEYKKDVSH